VVTRYSLAAAIQVHVGSNPILAFFFWQIVSKGRNLVAVAGIQLRLKSLCAGNLPLSTYPFLFLFICNGDNFIRKCI
jgi:hypothetical protein